MIYDKKALNDFVDRWRGKGYEKGETHQFWTQLLKAIGYPHADDVLFERRLPSGGFIDVWLRDAGVLIEQKSLGVDLDKEEPRQGKLKTPLDQALDYVDELPLLEQPRYVVTCNFETFRVYDRNPHNRSELPKHAFEFKLDELAERPEYLRFINDPANSRLEREKQVSIQAGELVGKLYDKLREGYLDPDSEESKHALNVLCVRLVFCLYCEDADLFEKDAFYNYLKDVPVSGIRKALRDLFRALDTELADRDPYDLEIKKFPYVNGGLFRGDFEIPNFTEETKRFLLEEASKPVDWSQISPTIFGGIFESTLNPETRRSGGMHYTSPENIHKVIDPLFLDDLKTEFAAIRDEEGTTPRKRKAALTNFHKKLCSLKFFDPACGSGNFLTETYLCLRKLEDAVLRELWKGQTVMGFGDEAITGDRVKLSQFYGIEINDFAVAVARTALWISRLKANGDASMFMEMGNDDFPLQESANIVQGNALRIDWNDVLSASECSFIMGNPPFVGASFCTSEQKKDIVDLFGKIKLSNSLDYVTGWYYKSCGQMKLNKSIKAALVSTNSVSQGEQVAPLWRTLQDRFGVRIEFAWRTFVWNNEATNQAHVHCVIIGFSTDLSSMRSVIFDSSGEAHKAKNINAYLVDAPFAVIESRSKPLCVVPELTKGNQPTDDGNLILSVEEREELLRMYPEVQPLVRRYVGARDYLNNNEIRYCIWLKDVSTDRYSHCKPIMERLEAVRLFRAMSTATPTRKFAEKPWQFFSTPQTGEDYIIVPRVSSQRRIYIPMGFMRSNVIAADSLSIVCGASLYHLGVMMSQFHNAWMRVVAGRLKSDYRYSGGIVYNNFVWPDSTPKQRETIENLAQAVLDARANYPDKSLADLYDPDKTPSDLLAAHKALDKAVEAAYGVDFDGDEEKIVAHLFKLYAEKTAKK